MSEAFDRVLGINTLPLFPLPLVLLPNEMLPLHIFEPRYRQMLLDVEQTRNIFGITYFDADESATDGPAVGSIGCAAEIRDVQIMPDGRSNIITQGIIRYRIVEYAETGTPYLTIKVEFFEDEPDDTPQLQMIADEVHEVFGRIAKAAFKLSDNRGQIPEIPRTEPEKLSFLITAAFNLENELKSELLAMTVTAERLERLRTILLTAVDQMEDSAEIHRVARSNGHSDKKIDLG
jgi:Lon protease-like protein